VSHPFCALILFPSADCFRLRRTTSIIHRAAITRHTKRRSIYNRSMVIQEVAPVPNYRLPWHPEVRISLSCLSRLSSRGSDRSPPFLLGSADCLLLRPTLVNHLSIAATRSKMRRNPIIPKAEGHQSMSRLYGFGVLSRRCATQSSELQQTTYGR
jgi:hypothetical protein